MPGSRFEIRVSLEPWACFVLCLIILMVPLKWLVAWFISAAVHEIGHLLAASILSVKVHRMTIGLSGARIETAPMDTHQELLCAAAGPLAGSLLVFAGRYIPLTALVALFHTIWNLIPFGKSDGARVSQCLWTMVRKIPCKPGQERVQ